MSTSTDTTPAVVGLTPVELSALRFESCVRHDDDVFTHAILRALDAGNRLEKQGLEALFPQIFAAWTALRDGRLRHRVEQIGGAR